MVQYAKTNSITNIFEEENAESDLITQLNPETTVAVIEHGCLWSKIVRDLYQGYCRTENLTFENGSDIEKESNLVISIPRDCACALYNALKFSLKL